MVKEALSVVKPAQKRQGMDEKRGKDNPSDKAEKGEKGEKSEKGEKDEKMEKEEKDKKPPRKVTDSLLDAARRVAKSVKAKAIFICAAAPSHYPSVVELAKEVPVILAVHSDQLPEDVRKAVHSIVSVPKIQLTRTGQIKLAVLMAMAQGVLGPEDVLICLTGLPSLERLDSMVILSVKDEFELFASGDALLSEHVQPEVFERVVDIAIQLAVEGREGHPVGTMFVVGDYENVSRYATQLVLNPFKGYAEEDRNILDPSLTETIKEFSAIDGAFVVRGDGVVESAGTFLQPGVLKEPLPLGLGTRHAAAAGISSVTQSIAVTVSASTGAVRIFRNGKMVIEIERPRG